MKLLGFEITRTKAANLQAVDNRGWWPLVRETFAGDWQQWSRSLDQRPENLLAYPPVYACVDLIASDIGKVRLELTAEDSDGFWELTSSPAFSPVLQKPNSYQLRHEFIEHWLVSKLLWGNTYVLKQRDNRGVVIGLSVLDPCRVQPLVSTSGAVFYQLSRDYLSGLDEDSVTVPAREILHDKMLTLYHPLVGIGPLTACGMAALQGLKIQGSSAKFFGQGAQPSGVLTAPGIIKDETARRLKDYWDTNFTGDNVGKVAVLGDGLKYEPMTMTAVNAQTVEQLDASARAVCTAFHVPPYMIGIGDPPNYNNIEALNQQYYTQCLQRHFDGIEDVLDEGLSLPTPYRTRFLLEDLLRMDSATKMKTATDGVKGGISTPNEARKMFNLRPITGGDTVYLQDQDHALEWLAKRDAMPIPTPPQNPPADPPADPPPMKARVLGFAERKAAISHLVEGLIRVA